MWDSKRDTDVNNRLLDSVGKGKGGMIWENSIETYITTFETDNQSKFDAWDKALNGQHRGMGWGFGTGVIHHTCDWFMSVYAKKKKKKKSQYCKVISFQLKKKCWHPVPSLHGK